MPSSLINPKFNPALAARVAASVSGRRMGHKSAKSQRSRTFWLRLGGLVAVSGIALAVVSELRTRARELADAKHALLGARSELQQTLTANAKSIGERLSDVIEREASVDHGAVRHESLDTLTAWDALLARPIVYARVNVDAINPPDRFDAALAESRKDAFVFCLKQPPVDRTEKELLKRVNDAFGRGSEEFTGNVHRAHDALLSLRLLDPSIDRQIERAEELPLVVHLQHLFDEARLDERLPAVFGEVLIAVLDGPKVANTPVELDGASVHRARLVVVDISRENAQVLLRTHFDLDPGWVSERRRHQYAQSLEGCRMAYDVRTALAHRP